MGDGISDFYRRCEWLRKHPNEKRTPTEEKVIIELNQRDEQLDYERLLRKAFDKLVAQERELEKVLEIEHESLKDWVKEQKSGKKKAAKEG